MTSSDIIQRILFDYEDLSESEIEELLVGVPNKKLRWLGAHHPDNRTRKIFFRLTNIKIGAETVINQNFVVSDNYEPLLTIGDRVAISPNVTIVCASAPNNSELNNNKYVSEHLIVDKEVVIENNVWVGAGAIIMPGVTVHANSVIGAGSVVTKDVPKNSIVAGVPADVIKTI